MARNLDFRDYLKAALKDSDLRSEYRRVLDEELGETLAYLRESMGLSQGELAERLGVSRSRVSQMETAAGLSLSLETLARHAQALGLSLRLEFADERGEVLARYTLSPEEAVAEPVTTGWVLSEGLLGTVGRSSTDQAA